MLNVTITPHREFLPADTPDQRLFMMLKLRPTKEVSQSRPSTSFVFLIDTSGSMYEEIDGSSTKIDVVIQSLRTLVRSGRLTQEDRIAIVRFDDETSTLIGLTPATQVSQIEDAIDRLHDFSGGTVLGKGMKQALSLLSDRDMTSRRVLIFTDGETFDEDDCRDLARDFASNGVSITALGVGEYNEDLLVDLSNTTAGQCRHVVAGTAIGNAVSISDLPNALIADYQQAQNEVINNLTMEVKTVQGVKLVRATRVYPDLAEFSLTQSPYPIGAVTGDDESVFALEFSIDSRASARMRIAQLGLTYDIPGLNRRGELPLQNVVIQFVTGQGASAQVDPEVMGYVQQRNISKLVDDATKIASSNPEQAEKLLDTARRITIQLDNKTMLESLNQGIDELRKTRQISSSTGKTIKIGSRGKTVKMGDDANDELSDENIRKLTGT
jgi:Ca-activated chloride channel homolog